MKTPFLTLENISVNLHGQKILDYISWEMNQGEQWAIIGPNGAGKSTLVKSIWGGVPTSSGDIKLLLNNKFVDPSWYKKYIGYISFELHQHIASYEELQQELKSFSHKKSKATTCKDVIFSAGKNKNKLSKISKLLNISHLLDREIIALSSGEMRRTLIARALMKSPLLLILDEPFDGLDENARKDLSRAIDNLMKNSLQVILVTHRLEEITGGITHVLFLKNGKIIKQGEKKEILTNDNLGKLYRLKTLGEWQQQRHPWGSQHTRIPQGWRKQNEEEEIPEVLIEMKDVTVKYGKTIVLDKFTWIMKKGENWAIIGPNGAGKSTIVKLITGENLQRYANTIKIFGREIGTGETIWEIKKHIGVISSELQIQYRKNMSGYDAVASGFYDSIGLYHYPTKEEEKIADHWIKVLNIADLTSWNFSHLSYGQKRMILLARAMVKSPILLILDEPCHGLDMANRKRILDIIETIGHTKTQLIFITHHPEEIVSCVNKVLKLEKNEG